MDVAFPSDQQQQRVVNVYGWASSAKPLFDANPPPNSLVELTNLIVMDQSQRDNNLIRGSFLFRLHFNGSSGIKFIG
jgi:hypothetical protein